MKKQMKIEKLLEAGETKLKEQNFKAALMDLSEALSLDPENPEIHYYLGIIHTRMENYERGAVHLEAVLASDLSYINKVHAQMILGYIHTLREEYERALTMFQDIIKAGFNSAQAFAAVGYVMDRMGNFKEAVMNLYRAIEINPKNANAHNSLGYIFAEAGINLEEALVECKKAVTLDGDNPAYLDSLGWAYYKLGRLSQAKSYLTKAHKRAGDNEEIKKHLKVVTEAQSRKAH